VTNEPAPTDPDAVSLVEELRGQPGTRVPHAWVQHGGNRVSTLDMLGPAFTLLTGDNGALWSDAAAATSAALGVPIGIRRIGPEGDVVDADGKWGQVTGLAPDGALLVRPDDFVGWRTEELPADPEAELRHAVSNILYRS
jgi:putative polyketide hydroxylase